MTEHERALSSSFLSVHRHAHTHRGSSNESFTSSTWSCSCERFLFALILPFYFLHYLTHSFPFTLHLKFVDYLNLLRTPHKEGMDSSDEFLLTTQMVRRIRDACSCVTVQPSVRVAKLLKQSLHLGDPDVPASTRRTKQKFTAAFVPSVEAWAVTVSPGTRDTFAMLEAGLLAASTSASTGE